MTPFGVLKHELFVVMVMFQVVVGFFSCFLFCGGGSGKNPFRSACDLGRPGFVPFFLGDIRWVIL